MRQEHKAWESDEDATKEALQAAREEADNFRKLLAENEADSL